MPVFRTLMRIAKSNIGSILVSACVFVALSLSFASFFEDSTTAYFEESSLDICVLNRDDSELGQAIEGFLATKNNIVELEDNKEVLQDELYYRNVDYILIIPKGFEASFVQGNDDITLENIKVPGSSTGTYVDMQIDGFLSTLNIYIQSGFDLGESIEYAKYDVSQEVTVEMPEGQESQLHDAYFWYRFLPYAMVAIMITILCPVLLIFNTQNLKRRINVSPLTGRSKNFQIILGCLLISLVLFIAFNLLPLILYGESMSGQIGLYLVVNSLALTAVSASVAYLVGQLLNSIFAVSAASTIVSLAMAFLCGVFVDRDIMSESVNMATKLLPVTWYMNFIEEIRHSTAITASLKSTFTQGVSIQFILTLAIFTVGFLISHYKRLHPSAK